MVLPDDSQRQAALGASFILQWFESIFAEDEYARSATRRVLTELAVFYVFIGIGFLALYLTWRSNANLKKWKSDFAATIAKQKGRQFEPSDAAKLYGMF
ncbi:hypothetical protein ABPG75_000942 [Micractinium tetrahymenae]